MGRQKAKRREGINVPVRAGASSVPRLSEKEQKEDAERRLVNFLDTLHRGQELPPEIEKQLLGHAVDIYNESRERAEGRFKFAEEGGTIFSASERIRIWQNEFKKTALEQLEGIVKPVAEERVDALIATFPPKGRKEMEADRDQYVQRMQRYLAMNPKHLSEEPREAAQKREVLVMIKNIREEIAKLNRQIANLNNVVK